MKRENILLLIVVVVIIATSGFWFFNYRTSFFKSKAISPAGMILFYKDSCSHCKVVEDFITANDVEEKVEFTRLEVSNSNADNQKTFIEKATICQIPEADWGVPLFWDSKTCVLGDQDIIRFFQDKLKLK